MGTGDGLDFLKIKNYFFFVHRFKTQTVHSLNSLSYAGFSEYCVSADNRRVKCVEINARF
jgi:hypothetical protein